jgi:2-iminobutanoate/2-iminopropanoate deaminase
MKKVSISSEKAPKAASFFSQGILTANKFTLELSGQIGMNPQTGKLVESGVGSQTEQIFKNIENVLSELGWSFDNITKTRIYLVAMSDYQEMNDVYAKKFGDSPPARVAVAVKELPLGATVEIECIAEGNKISEEGKTKYNL